MKAWAIKQWNKVFETPASRKLVVLDYVAAPTKKESSRYDRLMSYMPGVAAFGHFRAISCYAATLPCRGLLVRSGEAMSIDEVALKIGTPPTLLRRSWAILTDSKIGWLIQVEFDAADLPSLRYWPADNPPPIRRESAAPTADAQQNDGGFAGTRTRARAVHPPTPETHPPTRSPPPPPAERGEDAISAAVAAAHPGAKK